MFIKTYKNSFDLLKAPLSAVWMKNPILRSIISEQQADSGVIKEKATYVYAYVFKNSRKTKQG